jgi:hypothetical protein
MISNVNASCESLAARPWERPTAQTVCTQWHRMSAKVSQSGHVQRVTTGLPQPEQAGSDRRRRLALRKVGQTRANRFINLGAKSGVLGMK